MKKLLIITVLLSLFLCACGEKEDVSKSDTSSEAASVTESSESAATNDTARSSKAEKDTDSEKPTKKPSKKKEADSDTQHKAPSSKKDSSSKKEKSSDTASVSSKPKSKPESAPSSSKVESKEESSKPESSNIETTSSQQPAEETDTDTDTETTTDIDTDTELTNEDPFAGTYYEYEGGRGVLTITDIGNNIYSVTIKWANSAFETIEWSFSGEFNGRGVLFYSNGAKTVYTTDENGETSEKEAASDTTGYIQMGNMEPDMISVLWKDDIETEMSDKIFIKQ